MAEERPKIHVWRPIEWLSALEVEQLPDPDVRRGFQRWSARSAETESTQGLHRYLEQVERRWSIETGVIEDLYTLDRGITETLIKHGIKASLIPHDATNKDTNWVAETIQIQKTTLEGLFQFVKGERPISTSYIKELHAQLTQLQDRIYVRDQFGKLFETTLLKGQYKQLPNNPRRTDGAIYEYCPPLRVEEEMERLISCWKAHESFAPEVLSAWVHHRFTQIHPFQDGNGRVARCLASLVFLKAGLFPLVVTRDERFEYIEALEKADDGELAALVKLFAGIQKRLIEGAHSFTRAEDDIF